MYKTTIASAALMATAVLAQSPGKAIVVNGCNYDVHLSAVPAAYGGYEQFNKILAPNGTFEQTFTQLSNNMGWSIKLAKTDAFQTNVLQYEYTYVGDSKIWYDLSCVDGNPWDKNWEITATGGESCTPKQSYYRYATDDAFGMQDCRIDADITVLLCSGEEQNDEAASSASVSASSTAAAAPTTYEAPAPTYEAPSSTYVAPSSTYVAPEPTSSPEEAAPTYNAPQRQHNNHVQHAEASPTTFAVVTTRPPGVTVTEVATVIVTEIATATHYARDAHAHNHAARHPHARV